MHAGILGKLRAMDDHRAREQEEAKRDWAEGLAHAERMRPEDEVP